MNARQWSRRVAMEELVGTWTALTSVSAREVTPELTARTTQTTARQVQTAQTSVMFEVFFKTCNMYRNAKKYCNT